MFDPNTTQEEVYDFTAKPLVKETLEGFNCTILAYGQTGSGKTFSMLGVLDDSAAASRRDNNVEGAQDEPEAAGGDVITRGPDLRGVIPRIIDDIFETMLSAPSTLEFTVRASYMELYLERINDLIDPSRGNLR